MSFYGFVNCKGVVALACSLANLGMGHLSISLPWAVLSICQGVTNDDETHPDRRAQPCMVLPNFMDPTCLQDFCQNGRRGGRR